MSFPLSVVGGVMAVVDAVVVEGVVVGQSRWKISAIQMLLVTLRKTKDYLARLHRPPVCKWVAHLNNNCKIHQRKRHSRKTWSR